MDTAVVIKTDFRLDLYFERIIAAERRARSRVMRRGGAIVRMIMRRSIRKRKRNSSAGQIPSSHVPSSSFGLRMIAWFYDPRTNTTIIGPVGGSENTGAPKALNFGGRSKIKLSPRQRRKYGKKYTEGHVSKREFAFPALKKFETQYPELWKDAIK